MLRTQLLAPLGCALALIVVTTFQQGVWSERWGAFPEMEEFGQRVKDVPMSIGDWVGKPLQEMDKKTMEMAGAVAALSREYSHRITGQTINMHIVCGRMQDVFYHTPDRCYPAAGFSQDGALTKDTIYIGPNKTPAEFKTTKYIKSSHGSKTSTALQIMWSWSADGPWQTPESPKLAYAGRRALFKIYIEHPVVPGELASQTPPGAQFAEAAMAEITKAFFPESEIIKEFEPRDITRDKPAAETPAKPALTEGAERPE